MSARAAVGGFPYPGRTVAEVWGIPAPKPRTIERPLFVRSIVPNTGPVLIDITNAPSAMEQRFAGKRA